MFAKLLNAVNPKARIILLGDKEQLASVEAGSLLGDLCETLTSLNKFKDGSKTFFNQFLTAETKLTEAQLMNDSDALLFNHIIELKRSYRSQDHPEISELSKAIINSSQNDVANFHKDSGEARIVFEDKDDKLFKEFVRRFDGYITEPDTKKALEILNSSKILCGVKNGPKGVYTMNNKIEQYLKGKKLNPNKLFYENRPIIVTKNYKELELFNGDTGIIRDGKACFLNSDNKLRKEIPELIAECETVFAMSIHKSQGSEYKNVLVMLPDNSDNRVLTKELLYTGVTRAKESVILLAKEEVINSTINKSVSRASGITERIK
jgi:exodeoxyribonuclease V alpha subunit